MKRFPTIRITRRAERSGFTLTEMLVATALVVLIMLMFAQIYGSAVGSITEQRALANNDQKARTVETTLRTDLQNMTYRQPRFPYGNVQGIVPMITGDQALIDPVNQRGYFYISENDLTSQSDDVLQFTVMIDVGERGDVQNGSRDLGFIGKVKDLGVANEPDADDGVTGNELGKSRAAEISYFLRNGNLYRRVLLLRDPLQSATRQSNQPGTATGINKYNPANTSNADYSNGTGQYLQDFDYAATRMFYTPQNNTIPNHLWFHSIDSLANHVGQKNNPIALPWNRFGHYNNPTQSSSAPFIQRDHGQPREFTVENAPVVSNIFLGRLTHEETSNSDYDYPGKYAIDNGTDSHNRYNRRSIDLNDSNEDGVVDALEGGTRAGEDILLTNVTEFNIEVFDPTADTNNDGLSGPAGFVDLGHRLPLPDGSTPLNDDQLRGTFGELQRDNTFYGPRIETATTATPSIQNRIFDTWHPDAYVIANPNASNPNLRNAPFRALQTDARRGPEVNNDIENSDARLFLDWADIPSNPMNGNAFPSGDSSNFPEATRTILIPQSFLRNPGSFNGSPPISAYPDSSLAFEWRGGQNRGTNEPEWPRTPGALVQDGDITWECIDNRVGLRAIRITIRFIDQRSQLPRQLTLVHSFIE